MLTHGGRFVKELTVGWHCERSPQSKDLLQKSSSPWAGCKVGLWGVKVKPNQTIMNYVIYLPIYLLLI